MKHLRFGTPAFGLRRSDDRMLLLPDEREQAVLARATELRAQGVGWGRLGERLFAEGHTNRNGAAFQAGRLKQILTGRLPPSKRGAPPSESEAESLRRAVEGMRANPRTPPNAIDGIERRLRGESRPEKKPRPVLSRLRALYKTGQGPSAIAATLNSDGFRTIAGGDYTPEQVRRLLRAHGMGRTPDAWQPTSPPAGSTPEEELVHHVQGIMDHFVRSTRR